MVNLIVKLYVFLFFMWILILFGGGILVIVIGPLSISGFSDLDLLLSSIIKAAIAISFVIGWIFLLLKIKNFIFKRQVES
jgi:hypothetical protein